MRGYIICIVLLLLCLAITSNGQAQSVNFQDGFEDGDFSNNPAWNGDTNQFTVVDENPNYLLQLNASVSPAYLSTASSQIIGSWEFYIEFRGFEPSGSNQANIFLMSDIANLTGNVNGYSVQVGQSGDDFFKIVRYDNGSEATTILTDTTVVQGGMGYTIKATRSQTGTWQLEVGKGYGGPLHNSGNTGTDSTYTSASFFGPKVNFTSTRADKFFFDFKIDLPPFVTTKANLSGGQSVDIAFNRSVDQTTVSNGDFSLNNGLGTPASISFPAPDTARITYNQPLPSNRYVLSVGGISDQSGNQILTNDQETFTVFGKYSDGDVKINEFMYDPPGNQSEYIEIKNTSSKYLNLSNWKIGDDSGNDILYSASIPLNPHSLLVISADTAALFNSYGPRSYWQPYNLPSLNNGGDAVRILTATGVLVDSLAYRPEWGGQSVALERRSVTTASTYRENWGDSPNINGGTPGFPNEIAPDTASPKLTYFNIRTDNMIALGFDERLNPDSAANILNYGISNSNISSVQVSAPDTVNLSLESSLQNAGNYTLTISGLGDIFGNTITKTDTSFTYYQISPVDSGDVAINEFMYAPSNSSEYIELYNHSNKTLNLQGWTLSDNLHHPSVITNSRFVIPPDSFAVLAPDNSLEQNFADINLISMGDHFPTLNNGGDQIIIRDNNGTLLDSLQYFSGWGGDGIALERRSTDLAVNYPENWGESQNGLGTPGSKNDMNPDKTPPILKSLAIEGSRTIALKFSERLEVSTANNQQNYSLPGGPAIDNAIISAPDSISLTLMSDLQNATHYKLSIENVSDIFKNAMSSSDTSFTYYQISDVDSGDVFINEFNYDPVTGSTEYVELYNPTDKSFNLENWKLSDNRNLNATITTSQVVVPPDSFVVIAPDNSLLANNANISLVAMKDFPSLNNSGDDVILRDANGILLDSLQYSSSWGGNQIALERRTISATGTYRENWDDSPTGGTPGQMNKIGEDKTPPKLASLSTVGDQKLKLAFDERVDNSAAETANYTITNSGINSARLIAADTVYLFLQSPLQNARDYTLSISGLRDIFGNVLPEKDTTFTFYKTSPVDSGDIAINEFMYAPPANSTEYIELYNHSNKSLDLRGWMLSDNRHFSTPITDNTLIVPPDSFAVLAPDNTILQNNPDINLISMGSKFPALNNGQDQIIIRDSIGTLLDSLQYNSAWGGYEAALERRSTSVPAIFSENWAEAPYKFGTPGSANNVPPDNEPPALTGLNSVDAANLQLIFSEKVTNASATDISHYHIAPSRNIQLISVHNDSVTLLLGSPLTSGETYDITISGLSDIFGNTLSTVTKQLKFVKIDKAQPGDVLLNEIMYNPAPDEADFVELYNPTGKNFDLTNWFIGDATGTSQIKKSVILPPDRYLILTGNRAFAQKFDNAVVVSDFPALNNNRGDAVYIRRNDRTTIDSLYYSQSWGGSQEGTSIERKDPFDASNDASNWTSSSSDDHYSAGEQNISFQSDTHPPKIVFAKTLTGGHLEVRFNEFIRLTENLGFSTDGQALTITGFDSTQGNIIDLQGGTTKLKGKHTTLTAKNVSDVKGNMKASAKIPIARPLQPKELTINEIMYDPLNQTDDNNPDQSEYIELRNTRDYAISLEGLSLHDAPDEKSNITILEPVTSTAKWVPARGYVLIYAENTATKFKQSKVANFFDLKSTNMRSIMRVDRAGLGLASEGDAIYLADSSGTTIDSVYYDKSWQNPNLIDTRGIALERINPEGPSNDQSNWGSSVTIKGGTPDKKNSIYQANPDKPSKIGISFDPNPFSPDNDGYQDNLFINYKLDQPDYLIRVRIYDRYGRLVRKLADGKPAGFDGQLIWDGRKNDDNRNRIGIYIVVFEAYNSATGSDKSFKKPIVLARKLN